MLSKLKQALDGTGITFSHFGWTRMANSTTGDFGVYAETGAKDFIANDKHLEHGLIVSVDLFTHNDSSTPKDTIEAAFATVPNLVYSLVSIGYDEDTGYIHYNWEVGLYGKETSGLSSVGSQGTV